MGNCRSFFSYQYSLKSNPFGFPIDKQSFDLKDKFKLQNADLMVNCSLFAQGMFGLHFEIRKRSWYISSGTHCGMLWYPLTLKVPPSKNPNWRGGGDYGRPIGIFQPFFKPCRQYWTYQKYAVRDLQGQGKPMSLVNPLDAHGVYKDAYDVHQVNG